MSYWYDDAIEKLDFAKHKINSLKNNISKTEKSNKKYIKNEINDILGNLRAPLDYISNYIAKNLSTEKKKGSFPFGTSYVDFKNNYGRNIAFNNEEIINHFLKVQRFNGSKWLYELNRMNNNEKHQEINKTVVKVEEHVPYMNLGGNHFYNTTFSDNAHNVVVEDNNGRREVDVSKFSGYSKDEIYIFKFTKREVLTSLEEYHKNVYDFVEEGKTIVDKIENK